MITRFYVDNYKSLVNFEYKPKPFELILGENGTGKTTFAEALDAVRTLVIDGEKAENVFRAASLTKWQNLNRQTFELELKTGSVGFKYSLIIEYREDKNTSYIVQEKLTHDSTALFFFDGKEVHLFGDDGSEGPVFPGSRERSVLGAVPEGRDNHKLVRFRELLRRIYRIQINPFAMVSWSETEDSQPRADLSNLASWYRHLNQEKPESVSRFTQDLKEVMPGFEVIVMSSSGRERREFFAKMRLGLGENSNGSAARSDKETVQYTLEQLSEGQRALIALYLLLHCGLEPGTMLLVDEPENFVALRELQPWLLEIQDCAEEIGAQVLLISHNPEFINLLAPDMAVQFRRQDNRHVRVGEFGGQDLEGLHPAEVVARGWNQ